MIVDQSDPFPSIAAPPFAVVGRPAQRDRREPLDHEVVARAEPGEQPVPPLTGWPRIFPGL